MTELKKGLFITFEGCEGCGKTTQVELLTKKLKADGYQLVSTREPGGTEVGTQIREVLLSPDNKNVAPMAEILLFAADRAQHLEEKVVPSLEQKKIVICDRYVDSTIAYQIGGRAIDEQLIKDLNQISTKGLMPEITFLLDIPIEEGLKRATRYGSDRFENEFITFHKKVREKYLDIAKQDPKRVKILNGLEPIEVIHKKIMLELDRFTGDLTK